MLRRSPYKLAVYGLHVRGWQRVLWQAVLYTVPVLALITLVKGAWILKSPVHRTRDLFQPIFALNGAMAWVYWLAQVIAYSILSALQEFFVRCGLQASMRMFDARPDAKIHWQVIIIANLIFASAHAYLGLRYMLAAFIFGLFWGWLFERQRSLVGAAVSHALIGVWALFVVGMQVMIGGR
jgi:membrane protease YdiL (CAAX protease family)